jgi:glutamate-5-semialdehyde dehydrogenase
MTEIARQARQAAATLARTPRPVKDRLLLDIAAEIRRQAGLILEANNRDVAVAEQKGMPPTMLNRLRMKTQNIDSLAAGLQEVAALPDPAGEITSMWERPNGLTVGKMRIPLGVIGIIYEARPNVTVDAAALCLKSGNAVILKGGSEALESNLALGNIVQEVLRRHDLPQAAVQVIAERDRAAVGFLLQLDEYIDLIIPRGGVELIRAVVGQSRIPVIKHYQGVCHIYVDAEVDETEALRICLNAKTQRPEVCNALETLLVHEARASSFLPLVASELAAAGVTLRGCERTRKILPAMEPASEDDWFREYLDLILAVRVVDDMDQAMKHIEKYGSLHTEAILTKSYANARRFLREVNSSTVLVNASTRFSDGFELGLGAEIGISTTKLHAFGPMGLNELTTTKFIVYGNGQVRT